MTGRARVLSILERLLTAGGVILLTLFLAAMVHREVFSRLALRNFDKNQASVMNPELQIFVEPAQSRQSDFSLWAHKRLQAYRKYALSATSSPLAVLRLDRLSIRVPVFEGTDNLTLNRGAGWIVGTTKPGEMGNTGIAGHRDGFFRPLKDIARGDTIELSTATVNAFYTVDQIELVEPDNVDVLKPRRVPSITLVTCYPFYFIGGAPKRFIVHAALKQQVATGQFHHGSAFARANQFENKEKEK